MTGAKRLRSVESFELQRGRLFASRRPQDRKEGRMKRLHVHVGVNDLDQSIAFYSTLFGAQPTVTKPDYAKWMLDDPRVNFTISGNHHAAKGIEHLGIQVESDDELAEVYGRLKTADSPLLEEGSHHLLLRQEREIVDQRSRRGGMGSLLHQG